MALMGRRVLGLFGVFLGGVVGWDGGLIYLVGYWDGQFEDILLLLFLVVAQM